MTEPFYKTNLTGRTGRYRAKSAHRWAKKSYNRLHGESVNAASKRFLKCLIKRRYESESEAQPNPGQVFYKCKYCGGLHRKSKKKVIDAKE